MTIDREQAEELAAFRMELANMKSRAEHGDQMDQDLTDMEPTKVELAGFAFWEKYKSLIRDVDGFLTSIPDDKDYVPDSDALAKMAGLTAKCEDLIPSDSLVEPTGKDTRVFFQYLKNQLYILQLNLSFLQDRNTLEGLRKTKDTLARLKHVVLG